MCYKILHILYTVIKTIHLLDQHPSKYFSGAAAETANRGTRWKLKITALFTLHNQKLRAWGPLTSSETHPLGDPNAERVALFLKASASFLFHSIKHSSSPLVTLDNSISITSLFVCSLVPLEFRLYYVLRGNSLLKYILYFVSRLFHIA